eukprot:15872692-Heterocapsa_arctica.AAC.1
MRYLGAVIAAIPGAAFRVIVKAIPSHIDVAVRVNVLRRLKPDSPVRDAGPTPPIFPGDQSRVHVPAGLFDPVRVDDFPVDVEEASSQ